MELLVLPEASGRSEKGTDEGRIAQSAAGKTIMTTEPKFIPEGGGRARSR